MAAGGHDVDQAPFFWPGPFFSSTLAPPKIIRIPWPHKQTQFFLPCPPSLKKILRQAYILHTSHHAKVSATVIFNVGLTTMLRLQVEKDQLKF